MAIHKSARNRLATILEDPTKGTVEISGTTGVLSRLFREMLGDLNISIMVWSTLMNDYLNDRRHKIPRNRHDMASVQGNLTKELIRDKMTWKVFCKGLRFLQVVRFQISIKAYRANGSSTIHSINVNLCEQDYIDDSLKSAEDNSDLE